MIKIFKTLLNIVLGLIVWFFIMVLFLSPHIISKIENDFLSNVLMLAWLACLIGFIWLIARDYTPKKAYSVKNGVNEVDEIKNKFNALCQEFHKNKREYDELEKIINSNLYIIQNNCQQKYLEYKNIKNETFILFDKLKVLNSDQIYTNKDRFLEFEQMCNGINKLKNISIILKDFISKKTNYASYASYASANIHTTTKPRTATTTTIKERKTAKRIRRKTISKSRGNRSQI
ncbi:MAG: hypothetical protein SPE37_00925 [Campylobacter sp.]|nr:hypothetical protein [Campylobacter sp.]